ncbi:MAG TPA: DUF2207 domain-containing protein [Pseudoxanthomonas sp.]
MRMILSALLLLLPAASLTAQEHILSYDSEVEVRADGSLDVTERIAVRAEGSNIRRGIYRDFPTRYKDRYGNRVVVDFQMIDVQRDGKVEPWFTESKPNGVRINTGNDDFLPVPAEFTYTLHYRTTRQLGFFDDHDELYWNAIGTGWDFPIERGSVEVRLPSPVPVERMRVEGYTGSQGQQGQAYDAKITGPGVARWLLTQPLAPNEGFTIVLSFPKGVITAPTTTQRWLWLLKDNRGVLIALAGLIGLLLYCVRRWQRVGRDPESGVIIARYDPPPGYSPAGLRFMQRMGYDMRCFSSDLLALAVAGKVRIHRDKRLLKDDWELEKVDASAPSPLIAEQQTLLTKLFVDGKPTLELKNTNATTVSGAQAAHSTVLEKRFKPDLFNRNGGSIVIAVLIAAASGALALILSGGGGVLIIIGILLAMVAILIVFGVLVKAPTLAGRKLLDEIEGLKLYLGVAERDELKNLPGPDAPPVLDAKRYEMLLPYAVALEVEDAWTEKFTLAAGAAAVAAATAGISWYQGGRIGDLGSFSNAIGSSLTSQIASSSHVPGSSSGGSGGGSSGGGGGGGGGGGR